VFLVQTRSSRAPPGALYDMGVDMGAEPICQKSHDIANLTGSVLFLVRNYKECVPRHQRTIGSRADTDILLRDYSQMIKEFDSFSGPKKILYYEDLIKGKKSFFKDVLDFFECDDGYLQEFIFDIEKHRNMSIQFYNRNGQPSITKGQMEIFHSFRLDDEIWDIKMKNNLGEELYYKYLDRYEYKRGDNG